MTASSADSPTVTTMPTAPSKPRRRARDACRRRDGRRAIADAPSPTSAGVFGIARTTGRPGTSASSDAIVTPAAIDSTSVSLRSDDSAACRLAATSPGFTATITTSASATAHAGLGTTRTFGNSCSSSRRRSASTSATASSSAIPARRRAGRRAARNPSSRRRSGPRCVISKGVTLARCDDPGTEHVRARGTFGTAPHFPERGCPSRTSGPAAFAVLRRQERP